MYNFCREPPFMVTKGQHTMKNIMEIRLQPLSPKKIAKIRMMIMVSDEKAIQNIR